MTDLDIKNLKVGDEVGYGRLHWSGFSIGGISAVKRITKRFIELDNGKKFGNRGWEWGGIPYHCESLYPASEIRDELERQKIRDQNRRLWYEADDAMGRAKELSRQDTPLSKPVVAALKSIVAACPKAAKES